MNRKEYEQIKAAIDCMVCTKWNEETYWVSKNDVLYLLFRFRDDYIELLEKEEIEQEDVDK